MENWELKDFVPREIGEITVNTFNGLVIQGSTDLVFLHVPLMVATKAQCLSKVLFYFFLAFM